MQRFHMSKPIQILGAVVAGGLAVACSSGTSGDGTGTGGESGSCQPYVVPAGTDLTTPAVTFKAQVMGTVFLNNCGTSACHGAMPGMGGMFLGVTAADAPTVYAGIVGKASSELPTMPFITAGDPEKSYLMHKMDGDQCQFDHECTTENCLAVMPSGATMPLPVTYRDLVRRWIAQGAMND
jgi:hypothetical protein